MFCCTEAAQVLHSSRATPPHTGRGFGIPTNACPQVCYGCAYQLCSRGLSTPICPFCRGKIADFASIPTIKEFQRIEQEMPPTPKPSGSDR